MTMNNDLIQIIDRTALIENLLNQVIEKYCSPRKEALQFFWEVVLDSSIMRLGAKIKVAMAISQKLNVKLAKNSLHELVSYRNAFAHHSLDSHPILVVGKTPDQDETRNMLHIIRSSGETDRKHRDTALREFMNAYEEGKKSLVDLLNAVKAGRQKTGHAAP